MKHSIYAENFTLQTSCYSLQNPNDLAHIRPNQATFGSNSLLSIEPQIWNNLPSEMKSGENLKTFKRLIKNWDGPLCRYSACQCLPTGLIRIILCLPAHSQA